MRFVKKLHRRQWQISPLDKATFPFLMIRLLKQCLCIFLSPIFVCLAKKTDVQITARNLQYTKIFLILSTFFWQATPRPVSVRRGRQALAAVARFDLLFHSLNTIWLKSRHSILRNFLRKQYLCTFIMFKGDFTHTQVKINQPSLNGSSFLAYSKPRHILRRLSINIKFKVNIWCWEVGVEYTESQLNYICGFIILNDPSKNSGRFCWRLSAFL